MPASQQTLRCWPPCNTPRLAFIPTIPRHSLAAHSMPPAQDSAWQIMDPRLGQLALQSNAFGGSYDVWTLWVKRMNSRPSFVMVRPDAALHC